MEKIQTFVGKDGQLLDREIKGVCGRFLAWLAIKWKKRGEGGQTFVMLAGEPPIGAQPS